MNEMDAVKELRQSVARVAHMRSIIPPIGGEQLRHEKYHLSAAAEKLLPSVLDELESLRAFKIYVHKRLDDAGVPTDPESSHKAEGCRIGGRLDIVISAYSKVPE